MYQGPQLNSRFDLIKTSFTFFDLEIKSLHPISLRLYHHFYDSFDTPYTCSPLYNWLVFKYHTSNLIFIEIYPFLDFLNTNQQTSLLLRHEVGIHVPIYNPSATTSNFQPCIIFVYCFVYFFLFFFKTHTNHKVFWCWGGEESGDQPYLPHRIRSNS